MKGTGKRVLSVSLAVMMALGMPSGTFAAAPDAEAFEQTSEAEVPVAEPETTAEVTQQAAQITENAETTKEPVTEEITQEEQVTESKQEKAEEVAGEVSETKDNAAEAETPKELPDLKVTKTELIETKEEYLVTVYTDSTVYDQLYVGKKEDTEKTPVVEGKKSPNGQYIFQFAVSEEKLGSKLQIVPGVKASGECVRLAAEELKEEYPDRKILVVDSLCASLGEGLFVYKAVQMKEAGASVDEVAAWLEEHKQNFCHVFTVDDLFHLYRGGRVSKAAAIVGTMINLKPLLHVDDEGHLIPLSKVRGRKKSLATLVSMMEERIGSWKDKNDIIFISHGDCEEDAQYVAKLVREKFGYESFLINTIGATIGTHSGPGTVALFFMGEYR